MRVVEKLTSLALHGMAAEWAKISQVPGCACGADRALVQQLIDAEYQYRRDEWIGGALSEANLPHGFDIDNFKFERVVATPELRRQMHTADFTANNQNMVLVGAPGTGKTHLAVGIGLNAIFQNGMLVRYFRASELAAQLERQMDEGQAGLTFEELRCVDLVIIDGLGCTPLSAHAMVLLFQFISARNGQRSMLITSSVEPTEWPALFGRPTSPASFMHLRATLTADKVPDFDESEIPY